MGQWATPAANKSGNSMYWSAMWDDKHNFNKALHESMFLKDFVPALFSDFSEKRIFIVLNKHDFKKKKINSKYSINVKCKYNLKELVKKQDQKLERIIYSKIWILKFQGWILIYFFVYYSYLRTIDRYKKRPKKHFQKNILKKYIQSLLFLKLKKNVYQSLFSKKYFF